MKLLLLLLLFINIQCAFSQDTTLVRKLTSKWIYSAGYFDYNLELKGDGRYKLSMGGDNIERFSEGYWAVKSDSEIVFNSDFQKEPNSTVKEKKLDKSNNLTFNLVDLRGKPIDFLSIKLITKNVTKDTLIISTDGKFVIPKISSLDSLEIMNLGFQKLKWNYKSEFNQFQIVLVQKAYSEYIIKQDEIWLYKNDRLYSPYSLDDNQTYEWVENRKDYYEKIKN